MTETPDLSPAVVRDEEQGRHSFVSQSFRGSWPRYVCRKCGASSTSTAGNQPCPGTLIGQTPASPVSVPEERQEVATSGDLRHTARGYYSAGMRHYDALRQRLEALAESLDALAVAVKGCGKMGPGGVTCGFYWSNLGLYEPCSRECREKIDRALHALLDGRTTT